MHSAESARTDRPRNVLHILSANTRRTKVVELAAGTHRVADDVRRHSLSDGEGGAYSTNLDRNRYGADNNYLFTVTRYNLESLGICPCFVDIEIVDTRNDNESQMVAAGGGACSCDSSARKQLADMSRPAPSNQRPASPPREMRRVVSAGHLPHHGAGMRRVGSSHGLRRPPSSSRLHEYAGHHPTHSRGSAGSELFDALLMAATDNLAQERSADAGGDAPVSRFRAGAAAGGTGAAPAVGPRRGSAPRMWQAGSHANEVDSLQNAIDAFKGDEEVEVARPNGRAARRTTAGMLRRNSVSMIVENPVLAQTGAGDSLLNFFHPYAAAAAAAAAAGAPGEGGGGEHSTRSNEGDSDGGEDEVGRRYFFLFSSFIFL
jgi:hypothetical protein